MVLALLPYPSPPSPLSENTCDRCQSHTQHPQPKAKTPLSHTEQSHSVGLHQKVGKVALKYLEENLAPRVSAAAMSQLQYAKCMLTMFDYYEKAKSLAIHVWIYDFKKVLFKSHC